MCACLRTGRYRYKSNLVVNLHFCVFIIYNYIHIFGVLWKCASQHRERKSEFLAYVYRLSLIEFLLFRFLPINWKLLCENRCTKNWVEFRNRNERKKVSKYILIQTTKFIEIEFREYIRRYSLKLEARTIMFSAANAV